MAAVCRIPRFQLLCRVDANLTSVHSLKIHCTLTFLHTGQVAILGEEGGMIPAGHWERGEKGPAEEKA